MMYGPLYISILVSLCTSLQHFVMPSVKKINVSNFSPLHNNVTERNVVAAYSLLELPLYVHKFVLAPSKCPVAYNPNCTLKQIVKRERERQCSGVKFRKKQNKK